jgi:intraflagellar transport protein 172
MEKLDQVTIITNTGVLKSNKSNVLYSAESYAVSLASSRDGNSVISGHLDGSVFAYSM